MPDVNITYKGESIASMDASGTKTLNTQGKYCEGNITVQYTDPEKPTQSKSVTPTESAQTVTPDSGKVLSSVSVGAIPSNYVGTGVTRKAAQTYTPTTTDQTIAAGQYLTGAQTVKGDANLVAANIKDGVTIFGVQGSHSGGITPSGTKQISITQNGTTTEDVTNYAAVQISTNVGSNYRCGTFSLDSEIAGTAVKVADLDAAALSHKTDLNMMLAVHRFGDITDESDSCGYLGTNGLKGTNRYAFGVYMKTSIYSSQVHTDPPSGPGSTGAARAYIGDDGLYLVASMSYKWKPGVYGYAMLWAEA